MQTVASKSPHLLTWLAGISIIVFCLAGVAAIAGWIPTSFGSPANSSAVGELPVATTSAAAPKTRKSPAPVAENPSVGAKCVDCGVIESNRVVDTPGETSVLGAVGGAVIGGVLGNQVGAGRGKQLATVAGAVGGAVAGNEIEKRMNSGRRYLITVRFEDGTTRVFTEAAPMQWVAGDRVKVVDGVIRSRG